MTHQTTHLAQFDAVRAPSFVVLQSPWAEGKGQATLRNNKKGRGSKLTKSQSATLSFMFEHEFTAFVIF